MRSKTGLNSFPEGTMMKDFKPPSEHLFSFTSVVVHKYNTFLYTYNINKEFKLNF